MSDTKATVAIPAGVELSVELDKIIVKGKLGEVSRTFPVQILQIKKQDSEVEISTEETRNKKMVNTFRAHIINMIKGVQEVWTYQLKVCSSHFPISAKVSGQEVQISNFLGEKRPLRIDFPPQVNVKVEGDVIIVKSADKELAGKIASNIEHSTKIGSRDRRVFMDGVFITHKAGKSVAE